MIRAARALALAALLAAVSVAPEARARPQAPAASTDTEREAADEYDRGLAAHARRDFRQATLHFERANELAANPVALEAALRAAILADEPVLGMRLAARAEATPSAPAAVGAAAAEVRAKLGPRVGRIVVDCLGCSVAIDDEPALPGAAVFVLVGAHRVEIRSGGGAPTLLDAHVEAGETVRLTPPAPVVAPPMTLDHDGGPSGDRDAERRRGGLHPAVFWVGAGATVVLGAATIASGVDVLAREEEFREEPTPARASSGQAAETRTYVLGAATGVFGLATIAVGAFAVAW
jgi:hypothetical protein